jgi:hypothetical protein
MSADKRPTDRAEEADTGLRAGSRKPYQKPTFLREQVFETMALACGKINPTSGACKTVKKNS